VIRLRAFRNGDPPALAQLWNRGLPEREVVRPLSPHEFNEMILTRLQFDAEGLIVAEDDGRLVGFAHAAFGPESASSPSHQIDHTMGTIAMLVVDPDRDDPALELALFAEAEAYLRRRGAKVLYAGGQLELSSYYWGVYGGSECSGVLDGHTSFRRAAEGSGYEPVARTILFEVDLSTPDTRDPKSLLVRRQTRLEVVDDARPASWWEASAIGCTQISRFRLLAKDGDKELAHASTWDMAAFGRLDNKSRTGLIDVQVAEGERRKSYGRFLVGEILRHCRSQWGEFVSVQTRSTNRAAVGLYESLGFQPVNSSTLYRRPGSRDG
jgi:ribosomal protein S18 acetylase RimI-like enzyme